MVLNLLNLLKKLIFTLPLIGLIPFSTLYKKSKNIYKG